ncbi:hypothetical protein JCM8547_000534 [Rhodosporidiobolus lusitaniae]
MTTSNLLPCFVCGKETNSRCPLCSKAGFETSFCSREHQVLVWPTHSKLCGEKANPFRWPLPSPAELEYLKANAKKIDPLTGLSIAGSFSRLLPGVPVERLLNDLSREGSPLPPAIFAPLLTSARSVELGQYEASLTSPSSGSSSSSASPKPLLPLPLLRASNLAFNIYTLFTSKPGLWSADPTASVWWTPLHARIVQLTTVHDVMVNAAGKDEKLREDTEKWYVEIEQDLRKFLAGPAVGLSEADIQDAVGDFLEAPTNE